VPSRTVEGNHSTHYEYPRAIAATMGVTEDHSVRARAGVFLPDSRSIYSKWIKLVPEDLEPTRNP
jgi:hypothetical protein